MKHSLKYNSSVWNLLKRKPNITVKFSKTNYQTRLYIQYSWTETKYSQKHYHHPSPSKKVNFLQKTHKLQTKHSNWECKRHYIKANIVVVNAALIITNIQIGNFHLCVISFGKLIQMYVHFKPQQPLLNNSVL